MSILGDTSFSRKKRAARLRQRFFAPGRRLFSLPRQWKQSVLLALDLVFIPLAIWLAVFVRWGWGKYSFTGADYITIIITMVFSAAYFLRIGLYRAIVRFMGQQAILTIVQAVTVSALILAVAGFVTRSGIPRSTPLLYWGIAIVMIGGVRLTVRAFYHGILRRSGDKVAIYGAGSVGRQLLTTLYQSGDYSPVVFVDDDPAVVGSVINGISVYDASQLVELVEEFSITYVFMAMPAISRQRRRDIIAQLESLPVYVKTVPNFVDIMAGRSDALNLQDIALEDLLGRDPIEPDPRLIEHCIRDKVVMVTGAGGSIGAELCRQILRCQPKELVLFDISEFNLYQIKVDLDKQLQQSGQDIPIIALLGSVQNQRRLEAVLKDFGVNTVYHAAAYKHVPMVEYNVAEGVANNVFGTLSAGRAAVKAGVETFVLISTDKAVRPTNVMGASKRMAELMLQAFARKYPTTRFCMVRFGNVLGSSGSVVPLFRAQINAGGPVTVTHKDIIRYFMTVQEAAQLVLQASAMGKGGDVFVLDMGEPVSILALARRMIRLMGREVRDEQHPRGDIEIRFTGLRPGEKLYEELLVGDNVTGTEHPQIMRAEEDELSEERVDRHLLALRKACDENNCEKIQAILMEAVAGFEARDGISDAVWLRRNGSTANDGLAEPPAVAEAKIIAADFSRNK